MQDALLREMARKIDWHVGQVIAVDTEDGLEKSVTIIGPSSDGDKGQMRVRFVDGAEDDWDIEDFVHMDSGTAAVDDEASTGTAAAMALQRELVQHGTTNPQKIDRLRRASMQPDDTAAAMMAAAAASMADAVAAVDEALEEDDESAAAEAKQDQLLQGNKTEDEDSESDDDIDDDDDGDGPRLPQDGAVAQLLKTTDAGAVQDALLREMARKIDWHVGQVIAVDTEDGLEKSVTIIGPSSDGDKGQMRVRFVDGAEDDWDIEDFVHMDSGTAAVDDEASTGTAAAMALQRELVQHGTTNPQKIDRLRRASMQPDDTAAAMMAAAAASMADAVAAVDEALEEDDESAAAEDTAVAPTGVADKADAKAAPKRTKEQAKKAKTAAKEQDKLQKEEPKQPKAATKKNTKVAAKEQAKLQKEELKQQKAAEKEQAKSAKAAAKEQARLQKEELKKQKAALKR